MARKKTLGYYAEQARRKAFRRLERLSRAKQSSGITTRTKQWIERQEKEIKSAIQGTRQYNPKTGKKYKSKSARQIQQQITRLEKATAAVPQRYTYSEDNFDVVQAELNAASVGAPSSYTKNEVKIFYRVTQKIWQRAGVGEHSRNSAILNYFNSIREDNGLSPLNLDEIVNFILEQNKQLSDIQDLNPEEDMTDEQREAYENAQNKDNADSDRPSPPNLVYTILNEIRDAMDDLFTTPNPMDI